jgi:hypothetical protein
VEIPRTIRAFVDAVSSADGERAGLLVTEDATFRLPGERELPAESDGRKPSVELVDAERQPDDRWVASLRFSSREVASGEMMYEMTVGGVFTLDGDRISSMQAFPSYEEAVAAAGE